jgi:alkylated DNA repair dioxygenase AlkB
MKSLFDHNPLYPAGFSYEPDFISETEEANLLNEIEKLEFSEFIFQGYKAKRRVIEYGYEYDFETGKTSPTHPIPQFLLPLREKVAAYIGIDPGRIEEALITEYPPGSVINWHRDVSSFEDIAGISLGCDCDFQLRPHDESKRSRKSTLTIRATRRSLYVMRGEVRNEWEHGIKPVDGTRYSITFRTMRTSK